MSNTRRLGRGLEALLGRSLEPLDTMSAGEEHFAPAVEMTQLPSNMGRDDQGQLWLDMIAIDTNPHQPRTEFDEVEIADLADSIREHGVLQPLVVRSAGERFQLIAGERRLRAARAAGWERVPVLVKEVSDRQMAEIAIVENVQRKDLSPLEKARSFERYLQEYTCTQDELARRVSVDRTTVTNLLRLLELPEKVKMLLGENKISQGHARALLPLGDEQSQVKLAWQIVEQGLSVRATEQSVADSMALLEASPLTLYTGESDQSSTPSAKTPNEQIVALQNELSSLLGTKVSITRNAKGRGRLAIEFTGNDEFERLRNLLRAGANQSAAA